MRCFLFTTFCPNVLSNMDLSVESWQDASSNIEHGILISKPSVHGEHGTHAWLSLFQNWNFSLYSPIVILVTFTSALCDPISVRQLGVSLVNTAWCDEAVMRMRTMNLIMMFHFMWEFKICFLLSSAKDLLAHVCRGLNYTVYQSINYYLHWWCQY